MKWLKESISPLRSLMRAPGSSRSASASARAAQRKETSGGCDRAHSLRRAEFVSLHTLN